MEKELSQGKEHEIDLEIKDGKLAVIAKHEGSGGGADLKVYVKIDYLFDKIAEKIPGQVDDAIFALIKQGLKAL